MPAGFRMLGDERLKARLGELARSRRAAAMDGARGPERAAPAEGPAPAGGAGDPAPQLSAAAGCADAPRTAGTRRRPAEGPGVQAFLPRGEWGAEKGAAVGSI